MSIGESRADVDAAATVLNRLSGTYLTDSQQLRAAATALTHTAEDSNRTELSAAVSAAHAAAAEADHTAATAAEAARLCSAYAWQL